MGLGDLVPSLFFLWALLFLRFFFAASGTGVVGGRRLMAPAMARPALGLMFVLDYLCFGYCFLPARWKVELAEVKSRLGVPKGLNLDILRLKKSLLYDLYFWCMGEKFFYLLYLSKSLKGSIEGIMK